MQLQQRDIDSLREELECVKREKLAKEKEAADNVQFWENKYKLLHKECLNVQEFDDSLKKELEKVKERCVDLDKLWQETKAALLDATAEVKASYH